MFAKTNNRKAISTVLTTAIILTAAVILGSDVVLYGASLLQTAAEQENIYVSGVKVWFDPADASDLTWDAANIINNGERIVSVITSQIQGTSVLTTGWYVNKDQPTVSVANFQSSFDHTGTDVTGIMLDAEESDGTVTSSCDVATDAECFSKFAVGGVKTLFVGGFADGDGSAVLGGIIIKKNMLEGITEKVTFVEKISKVKERISQLRER